MTGLLRSPGQVLRQAAKDGLSSVVAVRTSRNIVALTFDDGPDERLTPTVLEVLARRGVRATFFMVADAAVRHSALARRVVAEGHEAALHGDSHVELSNASARFQLSSLARGRRRLNCITSSDVRLFRPPYGKQRPSTVVACRMLGLRPVLWSTSALDWKPLPVEDQLAHVIPALEPGAVILLHDGAAGKDDPPPAPPAHVEQLLDGLLDALHERGMTATTVGELCASGDAVWEPWFRCWLHH